MYQHNKNAIDSLIANEIKTINEKYQILNDTDNFEVKQNLYHLLLSVNRQFPTFENEQDYLSSYRDFDR